MNSSTQIESLYLEWIGGWNEQDAAKMAGTLTDDATVIGFDGSLMSGPTDVSSTLTEIFVSHPTATYVTIIREIKLLSHQVAILRADAGMVPRGGTEINPNVNTRQTVVAIEERGRWRISLFQNTPAALHMRPDLARQLTEELRQHQG
jgi:uncharacterized protein (TIGR02246 family)